MKSFVIGIDVGGTNVKLGLVHPSGRIVARSNLATKSFIRDKKYLISALVEACAGLLHTSGIKKTNILGIGMGLPGLIDYSRGKVIFLPNISGGWKNVPLKEILEKKIGLPVFLDNDVNVIALGEWKMGAGRGCDNLVCMTLGTGVGGGLVLNGALYRGEGYTAGELGHVPLNEHGPKCNCGGSACFEQYVGNSTLEKRAREIFKDENISLSQVSRLADKKDRRAIRFWHETALHIGQGLIGVVNLFNPRRIIVGGGISKARRHLFPTIQKVLRQRALKVPARMVKIVKASLGDDAGILGAQVLVKNAIRR